MCSVYLAYRYVPNRLLSRFSLEHKARVVVMLLNLKVSCHVYLVVCSVPNRLPSYCAHEHKDGVVVVFVNSNVITC